MAKCIGKAFCKLVGKMDGERLAKQEVPQGVKVDTLAYLPDGHKYHTLNIYRAEGDTGAKMPVIIDVHGGGWVYGDKDLNRNYDRILCLGGFTVVAPSYRLAGEVDYVAQLQDVFAAFRWVTDNAEAQGFDLNNMFLTGDSAGAHLSSLAINCLADSALAKTFGVSADITFNAVNYTCGAFTPGKMASIPFAGLFFREIMCKGYKRSPFFKLSNITENLPDTYLPVHMITCDGDFMKNTVIKTYNVFKQKNYEVSLFYVSKKEQTDKLEHVFNIVQPYFEQSRKANQETIEFFKNRIKA